jgi:hypothetical protein
MISEKGHGKTNATMVLGSKIAERRNARLIVFETFPKWSQETPYAFLEIPQDWIIETSQTVNLDKTWIQHENAFSVLHGDTITEFLKDNKDATFLISHEDIEAIAFFEYSVIYRFYRHRYDLMRKGYSLKEDVYFIIEEAQNSLDGHILSSKLFRRYRKLFSEMRNMRLHAILISQRLQDLSTYFRCRTSLGIGKVNLDDFDLKLRRMLRPIGKDREVLDMPKGSFYFTAINDIIAFPEWKAQQSQQWTPQAKPKEQKSENRLLKLAKNFLGFFSPDWTPRSYKTPQKEETEDLDEIDDFLENDLDEQLDEDLGI